MNFPIFEEDEVVTFIRARLDDDNRFTDDNLLDVVEAIWDFYDEQGFTSLDNLDDEDQEDDEVSADVIADNLMCKFEKQMDRAALLTIIKAERDYEENLDNTF